MLRSTAILLLVVLLSLLPIAASASSSPSVNKEQAAELALQRFPGRVLNVKTEQQNYRIRVLQRDGRVVTVIVDGRTGRVTRDDR
ncbi:PepSY domain-containing protein [Alkalimonas amylolytica]|uniref:Peptidase propeptide and YPEB domain-containing protein n=1 Tax=Alkalimonas amylolytica TaxID=152573 RepID=A0A1H4CAM2_ALKAM|nr:PepSY domain-containing protein [Alkalimonas amylolytica]SEA57339.1 Peptidase propeptide and YPEB domain-containing protein [Alkalimonas amylolytica]